MAENKNQNIEKNQSNAERDQDEGNMNNGTIGGDIGIGGNSNDENPSESLSKMSGGEAGKDSSKSKLSTDINAGSEKENNPQSIEGK